MVSKLRRLWGGRQPKPSFKHNCIQQVFTTRSGFVRYQEVLDCLKCWENTVKALLAHGELNQCFRPSRRGGGGGGWRGGGEGRGGLLEKGLLVVFA